MMLEADHAKDLKEINMNIFLSFLFIVKVQKMHSLKKHIWDKVFKSGLSNFFGRQPLKNLKGYDLLK